MKERLRKISTWVLDIVLVRPYRIDPPPEVQPDPPPWDVPLDQTIGHLRNPGETNNL
jgi:hypothetical protein